MINIILLLLLNLSYEDNLKKGIKKYNKGKYQAAISILLNNKIENKNYDYYFYLGHSYSFIGDNSKSISHYDSAIYYNDKNDKVYFERGFSNFVIGDSQKALKDFDKAINLNPNNAKYYINRGSIKYDLGLTESACDDWYKAIKIDSDIIDNSLLLMNCN